MREWIRGIERERDRERKKRHPKYLISNFNKLTDGNHFKPTWR